MIDAILALVAAEFLGLSALLARRGRARLILPLGLFLASGAFLLGALRVALAGADGRLAPALLLLAFAAHAGLLLWAARAAPGPGNAGSGGTGSGAGPRGKEGR